MVQCLSAAVGHSSALKKFKVNKAAYMIQTPCALPVFMWLFKKLFSSFFKDFTLLFYSGGYEWEPRSPPQLWEGARSMMQKALLPIMPAVQVLCCTAVPLKRDMSLYTEPPQETTFSGPN